MNQDFNNKSSMSFAEFVGIVALMSALVALVIDAMLPALPNIAESLNLENPNDAQLVIAFLFIGMALGPLFFGPLSDTIGRRRAVFWGLSVFIVGTLICLFATNFELMLVGRVIQGLGASGPRIVSMAMVRDMFSGTQMARVMSFITAVFILVPAVAPSIGQAILLFTDWRGIFIFFLILGVITFIWAAIRQEETLPLENRSSFQVGPLLRSAKIVVTTKSTLGYTIAIGFIFGGFLGYLYSSQQIFQDIYLTGNKFPLYFSFLALGFGGASLLNAKLVVNYGMQKLSLVAIAIQVLSSIGFLVLCLFTDGVPSFFAFMVFAMIAFVSTSIVFGNLNALSMEPMGKIAGMAAAVIAALSTFISMPLGLVVGQNFNMTLYPMAIGFIVFGLLTWVSIVWAGKYEKEDAMSQ